MGVETGGMTKHEAHAAYTDAELLALTRAQIASIMAGGQAVTDAGYTLTRADLDSLWKSVAQLEKRIAAASRSGDAAENLIRFRRSC